MWTIQRLSFQAVVSCYARRHPRDSRVDSDAVVETLRARGLVAEDPRFAGRGRPGFLVTTPASLRQFGLASLNELPPQTTTASS